MTVRFTDAWLDDRGACNAMRRAFTRAFPDGADLTDPALLAWARRRPDALWWGLSQLDSESQWRAAHAIADKAELASSQHAWLADLSYMRRASPLPYLWHLSRCRPHYIRPAEFWQIVLRELTADGAE